ncbi:MAG TPA: potassium channel family protein [Marinobacter sp.]|nr:potassium channel family protein [Marinobacter sp.]
MPVEEPGSLLVATVAFSVLVAIVVLIHNEVLVQLNGVLGKMVNHHHPRLIVAVLGVLAAHTMEVWVFAVAYFAMHHTPGWGLLIGNFNGTLLDCVYFSFSTFTTVGYGDIEPIGNLRFLTGIEGLTGLVLIGWSASFLFVEMQRYWPRR